MWPAAVEGTIPRAMASAAPEEAFNIPLVAPGSEPVSIEQVTDRSALAVLESEWDALSHRALHASFFSSSEWTRAWLDAFQGERRLLFLVVRRGADLVGVVPLLSGAGGRLCGNRGLETALNDHSPGGDLLLEGDPLPLLGAVLNHLRRTQGPTSLRLPRLPAASPVAVALRRSAAAGRLGVLEQPSRAPRWFASTRIGRPTSPARGGPGERGSASAGA